MVKINKVGVSSVAKVFGVMYASLGLLAGAFYSFFSLILSGGNGVGFGQMMGLGAIILFPLLYGVMGLISGAIAALIYNVVAKWTGGIELELSQVTEVKTVVSTTTETVQPKM